MTDLATTERILADLIEFPTISSDSNLEMIDRFSLVPRLRRMKEFHDVAVWSEFEERRTG